MKRVILSLLALFVATLQPQQATAAIATVTGDAYTNSTSPGTNYGNATMLAIKGLPATTPVAKVYMQFDLSALPAGTTGADVAKATVTVFVDTVSAAGSFDVVRATSPWTEAVIKASSGSPTLGGTPEISVPVVLTDRKHFKTIDITQLVKDWLDNVLPNNGLALVPNIAGVWARFDSKETTATSHAAQLEVTVTDIHESVPSGNLFIGDGVGAANTTGVQNTALGEGALQATTVGNWNTALGAVALQANTIGDYNTALGAYALQSITSGFANTAVGFEALQANAGNTRYNTAVGSEALKANTTGEANTAVGLEALLANTTGVGNTALGAYALSGNGDSNVAVGTAALYLNYTGSQNTALGDAALFNNYRGSNNIAVGVKAGYYNSNIYGNNIYIGNQAGAPGADNETNTIRIGDTHTATFIAGIRNGVGNGTGVAVYVDDTGQLSPTVSSARFKDDIRDMGDSTSALMKLRPVRFHYKKDIDPSGLEQYGLVAEEVAKVYPNLVVYDDKGQPQTVRYHFVNAMLLNEVQKQARQMATQRHQLTEQARQMKEQAQQIETLSARLVQIEAVLGAQGHAPAVEASYR